VRGIILLLPLLAFGSGASAFLVSGYFFRRHLGKYPEFSGAQVLLHVKCGIYIDENEDIGEYISTFLRHIHSRK